MATYPSNLVCRFDEVKFCFPPREMPDLEVGVSINKDRFSAELQFPNVSMDACAIGDNLTITVIESSAGACDNSTHFSVSFPPQGGNAILTAVDPNKSPPSTLVMYGICEAIE